MLVSIIIASLNRHQPLTACLEAIEALVVRRGLQSLLEVIVVDQSTVTYVPTVRCSFALQVRMSAPGASMARNAALADCRGRFAWFLDDDALVVDLDPEPLRRADSCVFFLDWIERPVNVGSWRGWRRLQIVRRSGTPFYIVDTRWARAAGGFDERLGPGTPSVGGEDLDLLLRLDRQARIPSVSVVGSVSHPLVHQPPARWGPYLRARGAVLRKNRQYLLMFADLAYCFRTPGRAGVRRAMQLAQGFTRGVGAMRR